MNTKTKEVKPQGLIRTLTDAEAVDYFTHYRMPGREPPLSLLLSLLVRNWIASGNKTPVDGMVFYTQSRVHRILRALQEEKDRTGLGAVEKVLQNHLNQTTTRNQLWIAYGGWFKCRILSCFSDADLPGPRNLLLYEQRVDLQKLLQLPLADPVRERD